MKTATEEIKRRRALHHRALYKLHADRKPKISPAGLWRKLSHIELAVSGAAEAWANGEIDEHAWEALKAECIEDVRAALGRLPDGFFVNSDPRGYALKIRPGGEIPEGLEKDWGGNGILAPIIN